MSNYSFKCNYSHCGISLCGDAFSLVVCVELVLSSVECVWVCVWVLLIANEFLNVGYQCCSAALKCRLLWICHGVQMMSFLDHIYSTLYMYIFGTQVDLLTKTCNVCDRVFVCVYVTVFRVRVCLKVGESVFCMHVYVMTSINEDISNLNVKKISINLVHIMFYLWQCVMCNMRSDVQHSWCTRLCKFDCKINLYVVNCCILWRLWFILLSGPRLPHYFFKKKEIIFTKMFCEALFVEMKCWTIWLWFVWCLP